MLNTSLKLFALLTLTLLAQAGGSVDFQTEVAPLLSHRPDLRPAMDGLTFTEAGTGNRIGYRMCPALAGRRVGSYVFMARDRRHGGAPVQVRFATRLQFLDAHGKILAEIFNDQWDGSESIEEAITVKEEITAIAVTPLS